MMPPSCLTRRRSTLPPHARMPRAWARLPPRRWSLGVILGASKTRGARGAEDRLDGLGLGELDDVGERFVDVNAVRSPRVAREARARVRAEIATPAGPRLELDLLKRQRTELPRFTKQE